MPRAATKAISLADGPTLASTRDYWVLHLRSEGKSQRTVLTYLRALDQLDAFLAERGMPRTLSAIRREDLEAFFVALGERGNAPATISISSVPSGPFGAGSRRRTRSSPARWSACGRRPGPSTRRRSCPTMSRPGCSPPVVAPT